MDKVLNGFYLIFTSIRPIQYKLIEDTEIESLVPPSKKIHLEEEEKGGTKKEEEMDEDIKKRDEFDQRIKEKEMSRRKQKTLENPQTSQISMTPEERMQIRNDLKKKSR